LIVVFIATPLARRSIAVTPHNYDVNNLATVPIAIVANLGRAAEYDPM